MPRWRPLLGEKPENPDSQSERLFALRLEARTRYGMSVLGDRSHVRTTPPFLGPLVAFFFFSVTLFVLLLLLIW